MPLFTLAILLPMKCVQMANQIQIGFSATFKQIEKKLDHHCAHSSIKPMSHTRIMRSYKQ